MCYKQNNGRNKCYSKRNVLSGPRNENSLGYSRAPGRNI